MSPSCLNLVGDVRPLEVRARDALATGETTHADRIMGSVVNGGTPEQQVGSFVKRTLEGSRPPSSASRPQRLTSDSRTSARVTARSMA